MTIAAGSTTYIWIALAIIAFDRFVLTRCLPGMGYLILHIPTSFMHEFMHWLMVLFTGGTPNMKSLIPKRLEDGNWLLGYVEFEGVKWWAVGLVAMAPALNLALAFALYEISIGAEVLPWYEGIAVLVVILGLIEAGIPSWSDFRQGGLMSLIVMTTFFTPIMFVEGPKRMYLYAQSLF